MPHLALHIFRVRSGFDHPGCPGGSQAKPIHETEAELAPRWLDEPGEDVVIAKRLAVAHRLEHEIIRPVRLHEFVFANCAARAYFHREQLEAVNPLDYTAVHPYCGVRRIALGL